MASESSKMSLMASFPRPSFILPLLPQGLGSRTMALLFRTERIKITDLGTNLLMISYFPITPRCRGKSAATAAPRPSGATRSATRSTGARCASGEEQSKMKT